MNTFYSPSPRDASIYQMDGFLIVPGLFDEEEISLLRNIARADREKTERAHGVQDTGQALSKIWLSSDTTRKDIYNAVCHSKRMANTMSCLLSDEAYLYHYKMTMKEPLAGGAWEWHQDYGYWYNNGCLTPNMASCYIAVDNATRENGCMQLIKGSHHMGRIEHGKAGQQTGADEARVELALQHMELVYAEMEAGDALFFHSNTLHRSDQNHSSHPRWGFICCYNARHNPCENRSGHPSYTPLDIWPDEDVLAIGREQWENMAVAQ